MSTDLLKHDVLIPTDSKPEDLTHVQESQEIVKSWYIFEKGAFNHSPLILLKLFLLVITDCLVLTPSVIIRQLVNTSAMIFLNMIDDQTSQAAFGLYDSTQELFFVATLYTITEKSGIDLSSAYGDGQFNKCKAIMAKGLFTCTIYFVFCSVPVMVFCKSALELVGIEQAISDKVHEISVLSLPLMFITSVGELVKTFCMAQGIEKPFGIASTVNFFGIVVANYYVMVDLRWGLKGWVLTKTLSETLNLIVGIIVITFTRPETRGFPRLVDFKHKIGTFFWESTMFVFGVLLEYIGFELIGFLIASRGSTQEIAAYFSVVNIENLLHNSGWAFSIIARTRLNILLGMNKLQTAKNSFKFLMACNVIYSMIIGGLLYVFRNLLAAVFCGSDDDVNAWFIRILTVYCVVCSAGICVSTSYLGMKSIGKVKNLLYFGLFFGVICGGSTSILLSKLDVSSEWILGAFLCWIIALDLTSFIASMLQDWHKVIATTTIIN